MRHIIAMAAGLLLVQTAAAEDLKIGAAVSMTGGLAYADVPAIEGLQVAIDEINAAGGIDGKYMVEIDIRDGRSDPAQTTLVAQELIASGIDILITPADADPSIGAGLIAAQAKVPAFTTVASSPTLPLSAGEYMFGNFPGDNLQSAVSAQYARDTGYDTAFILYSEDSSYTQLPLYFKEVFEGLGGKVSGEAVYNLGQQDFSAIVTTIGSLDPAPDVIMTAAYEPDFPAFIRQLRASGVNIPVIGSDGIDSPTTFSLGDVAEGVVFSTAGFAEEGNPLSTFYKAYEKKFNRPSETIYTALGYDIMQVIAAAIMKAGSTDGAALRDAISGLENVQGAAGSITYAGREDRMPLRDVTLVRVKGGDREFVRQETPPGDLVPKPKY
ncbi:ABC transporter substrate-binding protein [Hoeflea prorocentri]|uniref:ABC transporter substrate-binding protein n=1 Tax=Hoeflea prorocentri TaxID=1922333 RepID=A0A9X3ZIA6_9HYPH|nr:ABC transporter substrate-binding protein [Hoeflea prorocentri]MCY6381808.1 ABC transporter substrate-binding protein [Hoeflea prorocentri]MDA5399608.1 ABC transporter substrate-binding protein [Hoeflea prorocentri]